MFTIICDTCGRESVLLLIRYEERDTFRYSVEVDGSVMITGDRGYIDSVKCKGCGNSIADSESPKY